ASRSLMRWAPVMLAAIVACSDDPVAPVAAIPPDPTPTRTIAVPFCADAAPIWAAFQDGDGAWTRAFPVVRGDRVTFRRELSSNHAASATLSQLFGTSFTVLRVLYGAPDDLPAVGDTTRADCPGADSKTLNGSVAGLGTNDVAQISLGDNAQAVVGGALGSGF